MRLIESYESIQRYKYSFTFLFKPQPKFLYRKTSTVLPHLPIPNITSRLSLHVQRGTWTIHWGLRVGHDQVHDQELTLSHRHLICLDLLSGTSELRFCIRLGCTCLGLTVQNLSLLDDLYGLFFKLSGKVLNVPFPHLELRWEIWVTLARVSASPLTQEEESTPLTNCS